MKKLLLFLLLLFGFTAAKSQFIYKIKADSVLITNDSCTAELIIENSTKNVKGFLVNKGNGRTEFRRAQKLTDSSFIVAGDTIVIRGTEAGLAWRLTGNTGIDSANNFLGTTDSLPLIFRTKNVERARITATGNLGINNNSPIVPFDLRRPGTATAAVFSLMSAPGYQGLLSGGLSTSAFQIVHPQDNYGLVIQRAATDIGGANLVFYFSKSLDPTVKASLSVGNSMGRIYHQGVCGDNSTIAIGSRLDGYVYAVNSTSISGGYHFSTTNSAGSFARRFIISGEGNVGIGSNINPSAKLEIEAGTASAGMAPLKFTSGTNLTTPEAGAVEFDGTNLFVTQNTGPTRKALAYTSDVILNQTSLQTSANLNISGSATANAGFFAASVTVPAIRGGTTSGANLTLASTSNPTKGKVFFGVSNLSAYDEVNDRLGIGSNTPSAKLDVSGDGYVGLFGGSAVASNNFGAIQVRNDLNDPLHALEFGILGSAYPTSEYGAAGELGYMGTTGEYPFSFFTNNSMRLFIAGSGNIGVGINSPSSRLHLPAGTATANTAPLKFTSGTNLSSPEAGAVEFDGTNYYATASTTRYTLAKTLTATATLDFGSTTAGAKTDLTITVTGAASGDVVTVGVPNGSIVANGSFTAWVSASNTVTVRFTNNDLSTSYDPASGTFRVSVLKY